MYIHKNNCCHEVPLTTVTGYFIRKKNPKKQTPNNSNQKGGC